MAVPHPTARLRFREMCVEDLDAMSALLGDDAVMQFYRAPRSRDEAFEWIRWNQRNYAEHGHGLWVVETISGAFVGDCGLTWQLVDGIQRLEVGYHVTPSRQGRGLATEAAAACRDFACEVLQAKELVAITHPENIASQQVAAKIGMHRVEDVTEADRPVRVIFKLTF